MAKAPPSARAPAANQRPASATGSDSPPPPPPKPTGGAGKIVAGLLLVAVLGCVMLLVTMSALATQRPQLMPFGVTGSSPVLTAAQSAKIAGRYQMSFVNRLYANKNDVMKAIDQGRIYGAYLPGRSNDTLLTVPSKSFFATFIITGVFAGTAKELGRPLVIKQVKPLPKGRDPYGAVVGLLLLPLIVGGLLGGLLLSKATGGMAAQRWRVAILFGFSIVAALVTLLISGPLVGAIASDRVWPLLPCAVLLELTVAAVTAFLVSVARGVGILLAALMFIFVGLPVAGGGGVQMMPPYWQAIGGALPPRYGAELMLNVIYFSSNNITTPVVVLAVYLLIPTLILVYLNWLRPRRNAASGVQGNGSLPSAPPMGLAVRAILVVLVIAALDQSLFASNFTSSAHNPVASNLPFAVVGSSPLVSAAEKNISLKVTSYPSESAAKNAIAQSKAWGALIPGTPNKLLNVGSQSDLAALPLTQAFEQAAKSQGQKLTAQTYNPTPLASGDPYAIVLAILITPLLLCGNLGATALRSATGVAADRYRGLLILGFAVVLGLVFDLIATLGFNGVPHDKFWVVWAIMALTLGVVGIFAAVMQRLLGAAGTMVAVIVIILFGKASDGGANGVPFLPTFWRDIGPYLPPRNAYVLLKNSVYFGGNGITQAIAVLLAYLVVFGVILGILDWRTRPAPEVPITHETEEAVAATVPAGVAV